MRGSLILVGAFGLIGGLATWFVVTLQRDEIRQSNERIAVAQNAAEVAHADAKKADARAAEANAKAETERRARLELEAKLEPRLFDKAAQAALSESVKKYPGQAVDIFVYPSGSPDIVGMSYVIGEILDAAEWKHPVWTMFGNAFVIGVLIEVSNTAAPKTRDVASALVTGLRAAGVDASAHGEFDPTNFPTGTYGPKPPALTERAPIRMLIGSKAP